MQRSIAPSSVLIVNEMRYYRLYFKGPDYWQKKELLIQSFIDMVTYSKTSASKQAEILQNIISIFQELEGNIL